MDFPVLSRWVLALGLLLPVAGLGQPVKTEDTTLADLKNRLQAIEAATDLSEIPKTKAAEAYKQAIAAAEAALGSEGKTRDLQAKTESVPAKVAEEQARKDSPETLPPVEQSKTLNELDTIVRQQTAELETKRQNVANALDQLSQREQRLLAIPKAISAANVKLAEVDVKLNTPAPPNEEPRVTAAKGAQYEQQKRSINATIDALKAENAWHLATSELLPLQHEVAKQALDAHKERLEQWREAARAKRETEVDRDIRLATNYLEHADSSLEPLAKANLASAVARGQTENDLAEANQDQQDLQALTSKLEQQFERAQKEAQAENGVTQTLGELLRDKRDELRSSAAKRSEESELSSKISDIRLRLYLLREEEAAYDDVEAATQELIQSNNVPEKKFAEAQELIEFRKSLLKGLRTDTETLFQTLAKLEGSNATLTSLVHRYSTFIDERVLWIRSANAFGPTEAKQTFSSAQSLLSDPSWATLPRHIIKLFRLRPVWPLLTTLALLPLIYYSGPMRRSLSAYGERAASRSCRDFRLTLRASAITLAISIIWPALFFLPGIWLYNGHATFHPLAQPFGRALMAAGIVLFPLEFYRQCARRNGLMVSHFGVENGPADVVRRNLRWLTFPFVPIAGAATLVREMGIPLYNASLGRVLFVGAMALLSVFAYRVADPQHGVPRWRLATRPDSLLFRFQRIWHVLFYGPPAALAVMSLAGYEFTAHQLAARLVQTIFAMLALWFLQAIALRWVVLSRRRLAMEQARARLAKASDQNDQSTTGSESPPALQEIDLQSVDLQTRRLVQVATVLAGAFALWSLWVDVLPALSRFDDITAWEVNVIAPAAGEGATTAIAQTVKVVSYADVAIAGAIFVMTLLAMRDMPGLLDLLLLQRLPLDAALRFAMATLTRYLIFLVGLIWSLGVIEIGWSQVQWLVAAISVGLGFGLQEIFANFVSGLIILFERPLRAGDIVTIDGVTGTVKSIHMRATIIQDLDRKDFVVPNKDFITGRLLNWTLSDEISRIVVAVGVAYGSDTDTAKELMRQAAENHPLIAAEPAPQVVFEEFGDSSLNLVLRCFMSLKDMPHRMAIIDNLHSAIDQKFRNSGIEIPFPQRDLHLRSSDIGHLPGPGHEADSQHARAS